jgi:hypothetical protein
MAKYHEIGRFATDDEKTNIDWDSALFHEEQAAQLGVLEAIVTLARLHLGLPKDVLVACTAQVSFFLFFLCHVVWVLGNICNPSWDHLCSNGYNDQG